MRRYLIVLWLNDLWLNDSEISRSEAPVKCRGQCCGVTNKQLPRLDAALRVKLRLRQTDVACAAGIGRWRVAKLEATDLERLTVGDVKRSFEALGARLELTGT